MVKKNKKTLSHKKTFLRTGSILLSLISFVPVLALIVLVIIEQSFLGTGVYVIGGIMLSFCAYLIAYMCCFWITFYDAKIFMSGEVMHSTRKTQFRDIVNYCDIKDVRVVKAQKNSLKQPLASFNRAYERPYCFIEFILENNRTHWMLVSGFTSKQKQKMLDIIGEKTGIYKNYKQLHAEAKERLKQEQDKWKV